MINSLFQVLMPIAFKSRVSVTSFYFQVELTDLQHPYFIAGSLAKCLAFDTDWLLFWRSLLSEHATVLRLDVRQLTPSPGPTYVYRFFAGAGIGLWPFEMSNNIDLAWIKWYSQDNGTDRSGVRFGPLGTGAIQGGTWFPLFRAGVEFAIAEHIAPKTLDGGLTAHAALKVGPPEGQKILNGTLSWPPSRQSNRRWSP